MALSSEWDELDKLDELGQFCSSNQQTIIDFIICNNGQITSKQFEEKFNFPANLFDRYMNERILPNYCTFHHIYGKTQKMNDFYIFSKLKRIVCPYCLK